MLWIPTDGLGSDGLDRLSIVNTCSRPDTAVHTMYPLGEAVVEAAAAVVVGPVAEWRIARMERGYRMNLGYCCSHRS